MKIQNFRYFRLHSLVWLEVCFDVDVEMCLTFTKGFPLVNVHPLNSRKTHQLQIDRSPSIQGAPAIYDDRHI